ncbi:MAG: heme-binding protein [Acidobacteriota bacterium]
MLVGLSAGPAAAQLPNLYGPPISGDNAKKIAAAALAETRKNGWTMAVAVVDPAGELVYFEKVEGTQAASNTIAIEKARTAVRFKRPTKAMQDQLAAGGEGWRLLGLREAVPVEGGLPLLIDGKIVGAIGLSGGTSAQDGVSAAAGAAALK